MAVYSVFDWSNGKYLVYQDQRPVPLMSDPEPCPRPRPYSNIGYDISDVLCVLPQGTQLVGYSDYPKGQVVRMAAGKVGVPANGYSALRRSGSPNLGGMGALAPTHQHAPVLPLHSTVPITIPGGMGQVDSAGIGIPAAAAGATFGKTFAHAIFWNVMISVASGILSTLVWRHALKGGAAIAGQKLMSSVAKEPRRKRRRRGRTR
jgi:hypothetical protein